MKTEDKEVVIYIGHDNETGQVRADVTDFSKDIFTYSDFTALTQHTITLPFPIVDKGKSIEFQVESLKRSQEKIKAEAAAKINNIGESIQSLLAIEYDGDSDE